MKIFLTVIAALVFLFSSFGQEVQNNQKSEIDQISDEVLSLISDAKTNFILLRGKTLSSNNAEIRYETDKKYFQQLGYRAGITYDNTLLGYKVVFQSPIASSPIPYNLLLGILDLSGKVRKEQTKTGQGEDNFIDYYFQNKKIAHFEYDTKNRYFYLYSNGAVWEAVDKEVGGSVILLKTLESLKSMGDVTSGLDKFIKKEENSSAKSDVSSNYTNLLNQCEENLKKEDYAKTVEVCGEAIKLNPNDAKPLYARGTAYYFLPDKPMTAQERLLNSPNKNRRLAIADLEFATKLEPKNADYFYALGMAQLGALESDKVDAAARSFTEVLRLNGSDMDAYFYRAEAKRIYNNPSESLEDSMNKTHKSRDRKQSAIADYTTYLQANPNNANALMGRGLVYIELGLYDNHNYELGIADLTKVISQGKSNEKIYLARGTAYIETGKFSLALDDLNKALQLHDSVKQPQWDLAREEILSEIARAKKGKN